MRLVRFVGAGCTSTAYRDALVEPGRVVLDTSTGTGNVSIGFKRAGRPLQMPWQRKTRDLFDLGVLVYIADELAARGEDWARAFQVCFPVRDPEAWRQHEARLSSALRFLSGDEFSFDWQDTASAPPSPRHRTRLPTGFDTVCSFSGGLDSLLGACALLENDRRVLLVGHHAGDAPTTSAQWELFRGLKARFGDRVELVQCYVAIGRRRSPTYPLPPKRETSHRARSFLFLALAFTVATASGADLVALPENGLIALNPPLGPSRSGTLSTRTAHPRFLLDLLGFVQGLGAFLGRFENPFLYQSKSDMVRAIQPWQEPLLLRSVSCAHAATSVRWLGGGGQVRHCGYCVPCIYRRAAMMVAGLDDPAHYLSDVFTDLHHLSPARQADMRILTRFARRVSAADSLRLQSMVVSHGKFPPDVGRVVGPSAAADYVVWADMLKRWADEFLGLLASRASAGTRRLLSLPCPSAPGPRGGP